MALISGLATLVIIGLVLAPLFLGMAGAVVGTVKGATAKNNRG